MQLAGTYHVPASPQRVWEALNDPEIMKSCIAGCESIDVISETEYHAVVSAKIGPVSAKFRGRLTLKDLNPPNSCSLIFEGQGGVAGFAKGGANVTMAPEGNGTSLSYAANTQIGGKLAQIGSRLVESVAKKTADDFFGAFATKLAGSGEPAVASLSAVAEVEAPSSSFNRYLLWAATATTVLLVAYVILRHL